MLRGCDAACEGSQKPSDLVFNHLTLTMALALFELHWQCALLSRGAAHRHFQPSTEPEQKGFHRLGRRGADPLSSVERQTDPTATSLQLADMVRCNDRCFYGTIPVDPNSTLNWQGPFIICVFLLGGSSREHFIFDS